MSQVPVSTPIPARVDTPPGETALVTELFRFEPWAWQVPAENLTQVHVIGEFNQWGRDADLLPSYGLHRDGAGRWAALLRVPRGIGAFKFLLNETVIWPDLGLLRYATVSTPPWTWQAVWYQIFVDRFHVPDGTVRKSGLMPWGTPPDYYNAFGGTLRGIEARLDHLRDLFGTLQGKALYLNPLHLSTASNHKYWPEDFEAIDPLYGTDGDLASLCNALHAEGARLIIDLVYNHTGLNHPAFLDVLCNGPASRYRSWYRKLPDLTREKVLLPVVEENARNIQVENDPRTAGYRPQEPSWLSVWGGKYRFPICEPSRFKDATLQAIMDGQPHYRLTPVHSDVNYGCWVGLFELPDLNSRDPEVRAHLIGAARKWIRLGVDGFRLDVPDQLASPHEFWAMFRQQVGDELEACGRPRHDLYVVGEIWTNGHLTATYLYGDAEGRPRRFDAVMNYPVRQAVLDFLSGERLVAGTDGVQGSGHIAATAMDRALHSQLGSVSWGVDLAQYNVFSSHDTRRLRTAVPDDYRLKAAMTMEFTLVGAPTIYYGDELGMRGGPDPHSRGTMRWDVAQALVSHAGEAAIYHLYQALIRLRERHPCLTHGLLHTLLVDDAASVYAYARWTSASDCALVVVTRDRPSAPIQVPLKGLLPHAVPGWRLALGMGDARPVDGTLLLPPEWFASAGALVLLPAG